MKKKQQAVERKKGLDKAVTPKCLHFGAAMQRRRFKDRTKVRFFA
jgi:hypothetical protein